MTEKQLMNAQGWQWQTCYALVQQYFRDDTKAALWMVTDNPMLGEVSPGVMISAGNGNKLCCFVSECVLEGALDEP